MKGGCHCGAVRYETSGEPITHALCHCSDCRRHAGAPMVGWAMFQEGQLTVIQGQTKAYASSDHGRRQFCSDCGTSLFYTNAENLPGIIDIQSGTFDEPERLPAQCHIQTAERISWLATSDGLPQFERFPPG